MHPNRQSDSNYLLMYANPFRTNRRTFGVLTSLLFAFALTFTACKKQDNPITVPTPETIIQKISGNSRLTLLTAAINRAGLATTLSGTGPFTVLAPSDDAFRAAGFADVAAINAAPVATLTNILLYHVVNGTVVPAGQTAQPTALTANGAVYVSKGVPTGGGTGVSVNGARVIQADVPASNGVVDVIDRVLMPPAGTVLAVAQADTSLRLLVAAALRGGTAVTSALGGTTPLTVFAPTNAAFRAAGFPDTTAINAAQVTALTGILTNHVVPNTRAYSPTFTNGAAITTFGGGSLTVTVGTGNALSVTSPRSGTNVSRVITPDINATNGVIHKIDRVLLP